MNTKQCKGCAYWKSSAGGEKQIHFCHYMLQTGKRREVGEGEKCLSKSKKGKRACEPFEIPVTQI